MVPSERHRNFGCQSETSHLVFRLTQDVIGINREHPLNLFTHKILSIFGCILCSGCVRCFSKRKTNKFNTFPRYNKNKINTSREPDGSTSAKKNKIRSNEVIIVGHFKV